MEHSDDPYTSKDWLSLYNSILGVLDRFGAKYDLQTGEGDYWVVDDDWGWYAQKVELQNLELLRPHIIKALQALLENHPDWLIAVQVDVPDKKGIWPGMGLFVYRDKIVDDLQRAYLPGEFRNMQF